MIGSNADEFVIISAVIENAETLKGYTEYVIEVTKGYESSRRCWTIRKRYSDFAKLNDTLKKRGVNYLTLPPKKFRGNMEREFVEKRLIGLQAYLNDLLSNLYLLNDLSVKQFFDPDTFSCKYLEEHLQTVSLCLRNLHKYAVSKSLPKIGWRLRKEYFLLKSLDKPSQRYVGIWTDYGSQRYLDVRDIQIVLDFYLKLEISFLSLPRHVVYGSNGALFIKDLDTNGSMRDLLCKAQFDDDFLKKYASKSEVNILDTKDVVVVARHLLEALKFLHERGLFYGHLHCGNISLFSDGALGLMDFENNLLGVLSFYRPYFVQSKAVKTAEEVDVYCFGQTLYELVYGECLNKPFMDKTAEQFSKFDDVLSSILSEESNKKSLPTVDQLLNHPSFAMWFDIGASIRPCNLKIPTRCKNVLARLKDEFEKRLREEQLDFRKSLKRQKMADFVNSKEQKELRKRMSIDECKDTLAFSGSDRKATIQKCDEKSSDLNHSENKVTNEETTVAKVLDSKSPVPPAPPPPPPLSLLLSPIGQPSQPSPSNTSRILNSPSEKSLQSVDSINSSSDRSALLDSIRNFRPNSLKKVDDNNRE